MKKVIVIGGGAAGFFTAINAKEMNPNLDILIIEKGKEVLHKVKISGGGRCNVTHACFEPRELVKFYPRGEKELLGPFNQFMTSDTFEWFENNGIPLKTEKDNRVFPESDSSQTIIDCFMEKTRALGIPVLKNHRVNSIKKKENAWLLTTKEKRFVCDAVVMAAGSSRKVWNLSESLGHNVIPPVPSLFTFNIKDDRIKDLLGISVSNATIKLIDTKLAASGPLLITHWGLSGPAILKLSAFGARVLAAKNYEYKVQVNWLSQTTHEVVNILLNLKSKQPKKYVFVNSPFDEIPKRLWERFVSASQIPATFNWADLSLTQINSLASQLTQGVFSAKGKSTFKEEFVTAGGVDLREINFKTFESKLQNNLFFIGEVLNIDAVTGGFNFQNAWTGGWLCAQGLAKL